MASRRAACAYLSGGGGRTWNSPPTRAEIIGGNGDDVLDKKADVVTASGENVTEAFLKGAFQALALAQENRCRVAVLTARSPSCGNLLIHDGTFSDGMREGRGVTAALLKRNGVRVFSQDQIDEAAEYISHVESGLSDRG